ncbi:f-box protein [Moniliophthora roreri MCA 2997]|uniref:F-box protein n=2 Tax=Moniliophthora roreri TaxID=221103 RepID=V2XVL9_MONRO|nr:f-box protein [Moniliophthora roreri MCA 2997]
MPGITDLPVELHIDNLLPILPLPDLLSLGLTNKAFATLCRDETLWKRKLQADFNFSGAGTARTSGWKFIYLRLTKPRVYVWGNQGNGRLGLSKLPKATLPGVPFPTELRIPGRRIVSLVAGGMSFHALDDEGQIYVWGTLDGTSFALNSDGYSEPAKPAPTPMRLALPHPTRSISCGRIHACSLDAKQAVWNFLNWGRPFKMTSHHFSSRSIVQVECGWAFSAVLTKSGDVLVWWPFSGRLKERFDEKMAEMDRDGDKKVLPIEDNTIPCIPWEVEEHPTLLPPLPPLPDFSEEKSDKETRLIQIAGYEDHLIGLTNKGHVLLFDSLGGDTSVQNGRWTYLPKFSELAKVRSHPTFANNKATPPAKMKITHVSAHFRHFIAYSTEGSSIVLMGNLETTSEMQPQIIPELQNQSIISVVLGDYHYGALTSTGKLLTWGAFSNGALGLGDPADLPVGAPGGFATEQHRLQAVERRRGEPPAVEVPTEVRFDHHRKRPKERFCVAAAASGWHMGALVIDLESNERDDDSDVEMEFKDREEPGRAIRRGIGIPPHDPSIPMIARGAPVFRVGFAGRGAGRGGHM